ncbi:WAT1-related protein At3g28050-like isoform X2 [Benincasa hispida]|uniref:WAT1-related protein At3g28050-like isoform X2 n=1 Tax=Benincasa hispida TaxID=102211 RepID=UPI00190259D5|nr:WAT1-related protein At3g28050-like isoform X2 [Benincasa hispida]
MMEGVMTFTAMIMVEIMDVITSTLSKAAMSKGMNTLVFAVYSNALATFLFLPFLLLSRSRSVGQIMAYTGIKYSSPVLLSALSNLIPIFTFLLAGIFRMEKVDLRRSSGKAKCVGTILAVSGTSLITLYKGPLLINLSSSKSFVKQQDDDHILLSHNSNWIFGGFLLLIASFLSANWHIVQTWFVKKYPTKKVTNLFFFSLSMAVQTAAFTFIVETNPVVWQIRPDIEMVTIIVSGIGGVVRIGVHIWCLQRKGPLYVVMFKPLGMVVAIPLVVTFLQEPLYLGSVMGSIVITCGFYSVIWGQIKQQDLILPSSTSHSQSVYASESPSTPLLSN